MRWGKELGEREERNAGLNKIENPPILLLILNEEMKCIVNFALLPAQNRDTED